MASTFKVTFRIEKLELEIEGTRDDVPLITHAVGQQFAGMLAPANEIVEGEITSDDGHQPTVVISNGNDATKKKKNAKKTRAQPQVAQENSSIPSWSHDPSRWGNPKQGWTTANKAIWLLHVVGEETGITELTAGQIANTFNKSFKQFKAILANNTARDLRKEKDLVSEDKSNSPSMWYLTHAGIQRAKELVAEALGQASN